MPNGDTKDLRKELNKQRKRIAYLERRIEQLESLAIETDYQDWIDKHTVAEEKVESSTDTRLELLKQLKSKIIKEREE